jgi:molybdopterin-guanine dinucleotide biosynthesis protein A
MRRGAIILCGGKSSRMGRDKATLPFGPELMLQRVVRLIGETVDVENIVVVGAPDQPMPELPPGVAMAHDAREYRGPLEGLATGLSALEDRVDAVYATGCDVPLLMPGFVDLMFKSLGDHQIVVPYDGEYHHPLAAVYRPNILAKIQGLLAAERLRPRFLFDLVSTREIPVDALRVVDPQLLTLKNLNRPEDYLSALLTAGIATSADAGT